MRKCEMCGENWMAAMEEMCDQCIELSEEMYHEIADPTGGRRADEMASVITDAYVNDDSTALMRIAHALNRFDSTESAYLYLQLKEVIK